jgi:hypothetical protein
VLEKRLEVRSEHELRRLANEHNMDVNALERVARYVNVPSIKEGSEKQEVDREGNTTFVSKLVRNRGITITLND